MIKKLFNRAVFALKPTVLQNAVQKGNIKRVLAFLDAGVNINKPPCPFYLAKLTMLHVAVLYKQKAMVEFLLSKGADINMGASAGQNALWLALENSDMFKYLLEKGADTGNVGHWRLLETAARRSSPEVIKMLVAAGKDVNEQNDLQETPLHAAVDMNDSTEEVRARIVALLECGARADIKDNTGRTALDIARQGGRLKTVALIEEYIKKQGTTPKTPAPPKM